MPAPSARISRLFDTFSALDAPLIARALGLPTPLVTAHLAHLVQRRRLVRLRRPHRNSRRPLVRVVFEVVA